METLTAAEFIAQILGPLYIIVAISIFADTDFYVRLIKEFVASPALLYMGGIMALTFGLIILAFHYQWDGALNVIVSLIGWLGVIKGVSLLVFPKPFIALSEAIVKEESSLRIEAVFVLVLGGFLTLKGFAFI